MSDILAVAKKQVEYGVSLGADQVEVYVVNQSQSRLNISNAHIVGGDVLDVGGAGVRVYKNKALGLASTTRLEDLKEAVQQRIPYSRHCQRQCNTPQWTVYMMRNLQRYPSKTCQ